MRGGSLVKETSKVLCVCMVPGKLKVIGSTLCNSPVACQLAMKQGKTDISQE